MYIPVLSFLVLSTCHRATYKHSDQMGSAGLTLIHSAMAAFENKFGQVAVFVCFVFQLLAWFVSVVQAVQSLSPPSKTGISGSSPG